MRFEVLTLGTGAALPARGRYPSAQLVNVHDRLYLVDCGEGTQERLRMAGVNMNRIGHILISHLHGDHYLGLMGLISTMHLNGRENRLHVHAAAELKEVIDLQLRVSRTYLRFPLEFHAISPASGALIIDDARVRVTGLELAHRIPTVGFLFTEVPQPRRIRPEAVDRIPHFARSRVKAGEDLVMENGTVIPNAELTMDPPPARRYAYCSDTAYKRDLVPHLMGIDMLYHEATFTELLAARAKETLHSTARQAGMIAREANVGALLLGHFSSRYKSEEELLDEARLEFANVFAAQEGKTFFIHQRAVVGRE
jgi:ribonuclease Z